MTEINEITRELEQKIYEYLADAQLRAAVIGVSGGLDSGINAVIMKRVCDRLDIPLYGLYISIETNTPEEGERADAIGRLFCTDYKHIDLTEMYLRDLPVYEQTLTGVAETDRVRKIRRGNIKARMRMICLYNEAQARGGLVVDNDNMTERLLGFFTLHGDVGDITPLGDFLKTEVVEIAEYYRDSVLGTAEEKAALDAVIQCIPTDGLGITASDVEQLGTKNYKEVDDVLKAMTVNDDDWEFVYIDLCEKYTKQAVDKVIARHLNSAYKRMNPYRISAWGGFFGPCKDVEDAGPQEPPVEDLTPPDDLTETTENE